MVWVRDSDPQYGTMPYIFDVYQEDVPGITDSPAFLMFLKYGFGKDLMTYMAPYLLKRTRNPDPVRAIQDATRQLFPLSSLHFAKRVMLPGFIHRCTWQHPAVVSVRFNNRRFPHLTVCLGPQSVLSDCNDEVVYLDPVYGVVVTPYVVNRRSRAMPYDTTYNSFGGPGSIGMLQSGVFSAVNPITGAGRPFHLAVDSESD